MTMTKTHFINYANIISLEQLMLLQHGQKLMLFPIHKHKSLIIVLVTFQISMTPVSQPWARKLLLATQLE